MRTLAKALPSTIAATTAKCPASAVECINHDFPATFDRTLYNVVPFDNGTADHIPGPASPVGGVNLEKLFGHSGFDCGSTASKDIQDYGFVPMGGECGHTN